MTWAVERATGSAAAFHARPLPDPPARAVWCFAPDAPALVLGSSQPDSAVDHEVAARHGVAVVRRRSGGGAVLLEPGAALWVDVVVPHGDPRWHDDVGVAFHWLGEAWAEALAATGAGDPVVHRGPMVRSRWAPLVCFAGLGPGEVTLGGRKVVGISQRRTRTAARFQCIVHRRWNPDLLHALLRPPRPGRDELAGLAAEVPDLEALLDAFLAALAAR